MFVTVKTAFAANEFYDRAYGDVAEDGRRKIVADGVIDGAFRFVEFSFRDIYETAGTGLKVSRMSRC